MANQRLNAKIEIGASVDRTVGRALSSIQSSLKKVGHEIRDVEKAQKDLGRQREVLVRQGRSVEALDREYADLGRTLDQLRDKQRRLDRTMLAGRRVGETFSGATREIGRSARNVSIGVAAAGAAVIGLTRGVAELGDNSAKTAAKLGMDVEALQELRYAAERSGVASGTLDMAMQRMTRRISEAARGSGEAKDALKEMGLSAEELTKMAPEDALGAIADAMAKVPSEADRVRLAMRLFDSEGVGLVNMLKGGSTALDELREAARKTGFVLTDEMAKAAEDYQDAMLDANLSAQGLRNTIGAALMPAVTDLARTFSGWLQGNQSEIRVWAAAAGEAVGRVVPIVGEVASGFGNVVGKVREATEFVVGAVGGWKNFGKILAGIFAARTVLAIGRFGAAVVQLGGALLSLARAGPMVAAAFRMIGAAMIANPIGAAITAIALAATLVITNWDKIRPAVQPVIDWLVGAFGKARELVGAAWENIEAGIEAAKVRIGNAMAAMREGVQPVIDWFRRSADGLEDGWDAFRAGLSTILDRLVGAFEAAKAKIGAIVDWFVEKAEQVKEIGGAIGDFVTDNKVTRFVGRTRDRIGDALSGDDTEPAAADEGARGRRARRVQRRAVGGSFDAGPLLVGEGGEELMYRSRGGFIAHARHTRGLLSQAREASHLTARIAAAVRSMTPVPATAPTAVARPAEPRQVSITINQAPGQSPEDMLRALERRLSRRGAPLFDGSFA